MEDMVPQAGWRMGDKSDFGGMTTWAKRQRGFGMTVFGGCGWSGLGSGRAPVIAECFGLRVSTE
jgi:hypothetical protein